MIAKDFRIGNLLQDREGRLCKVEELSIAGFKAPAIIGGLTSLPNKVIPLTEKWLLSFEFHKWGRDDIPSTVTFEKGILCIGARKHYKEGLVFGWLWKKKEENNSLSWYPQVEIAYVHQLQNLYFALTEEELTTIK